MIGEDAREREGRPNFRTVRLLGRHYLMPTWYGPPLVLLPVLGDLIGLEHLRTLPERRVTAPPHGAKVIIARPDHLGDLLQVSALTQAMRVQRPDLRLVLLHGSWTRELAELLREHALVDDLVEHDHPALRPGAPIARRAVGLLRTSDTRLARALRRHDAAVFLDGRLTAPFLAADAAAAGIPQIVGFGLRGAASRYTHRADFHPHRSVPENWLSLLGPLGMSTPEYSGPQLWSAGATPSASVVIHPGAQDATRGAPDAWWARLARALGRSRPLTVTGTSRDASRFPLLARAVEDAGGEVLFGRTSIRAVLARIAGAHTVFAPESFAAHAALGFRRPLAIVHGPQRSPEVALPRNPPSPVACIDYTRSAGEDAARAVVAESARAGG